jgi:hypothetical protein
MPEDAGRYVHHHASFELIGAALCNCWLRLVRHLPAALLLLLQLV